MARILIVDDESAIRSAFHEYAEFLGHDVTEASDGMEAIALIRDHDYDIIIMDVMMPKLDGFTAVKEIRKTRSTPIIMLSARTEEYDKLHGFDLGIDDYVTKPFSPKEVLARVQAIVARSQRAAAPVTPPAPEHEMYRHNGLVVDLTARQVTIDGARVDLTPKEADLLFYLIENEGIALTRPTILMHVWGYDVGDERTIDTHIKTLRTKLKRHKSLIVTLRGVGYRFESGS